MKIKLSKLSAYSANGVSYELKLPVIIHCRDAANEMIEIALISLNKENVLMVYFIVGQEPQKK